MVASWQLGLFYHMCGSSLLCANNTKKNSALYDACIMAAARVEPVAWRIHPKDAPASAISTACRHELPYSWKCSSPNGIVAARTPRMTTPASVRWIVSAVQPLGYCARPLGAKEIEHLYIGSHQDTALLTVVEH